MELLPAPAAVGQNRREHAAYSPKPNCTWHPPTFRSKYPRLAAPLVNWAALRHFGMISADRTISRLVCHSVPVRVSKPITGTPNSTQVSHIEDDLLDAGCPFFRRQTGNGTLQCFARLG